MIPTIKGSSLTGIISYRLFEEWILDAGSGNEEERIFLGLFCAGLAGPTPRSPGRPAGAAAGISCPPHATRPLAGLPLGFNASAMAFPIFKRCALLRSPAGRQTSLALTHSAKRSPPAPLWQSCLPLRGANPAPHLNAGMRHVTRTCLPKSAALHRLLERFCPFAPTTLRRHHLNDCDLQLGG